MLVGRYEPPAELTPAALIAAWEALQAEEVAYEAELLRLFDAYTKMQAACVLDTHVQLLSRTIDIARAEKYCQGTDGQQLI